MNFSRILNNHTVDRNGCWIWSLSFSGSGYGQFWEDGVYHNAHVYAYECKNGPIDKSAGHVVRHTCHVRSCCNPEHLVIGTRKDNYEDSKKVYAEANRKRRKTWEVNGKIYETLRDASGKTGISQGSIIKYTNNGIFDMTAYEKGCIKGKRPNTGQKKKKSLASPRK